MKTKIFSMTLLLLLGILLQGNTKAQEPGSSAVTQLSSSPELTALCTAWAEAYNNSQSAGKVKYQGNSIQAGSESLYCVSGDVPAGTAQNGGWQLLVGKEVVVPVIHPSNPCFQEIQRAGLSPGLLGAVLEGSAPRDWGSLLGKGQGGPITVIMVSSGNLPAIVGSYFKVQPANMHFESVATGEALVAALQSNPNALGFCTLGSIMEPGARAFSGQVALLPLDKNENGSLDEMENFYGNPERFLRAVWLGKYPGALCSNISFITGTKPTDETSLAFLAWVVGAGQSLLGELGYRDLSYSQKQASLSLLSPVGLAATRAESAGGMNLAAYLLLGLLVIGAAAGLFFVLFRHKSPFRAESISATVAGSFNASTLQAPGGMYYDITHTWAFMEKDGKVRVGMDDFLRHATGRLSRVKMKKAGESVKKGEHLFTLVQDGKQINISSPISGRISAINEQLQSDPAMLSGGAYEQAWVCLVEPSRWQAEVSLLKMVDTYRSWLNNELVRFRDFIALSLKSRQLEYQALVLQDGGELQEGVLGELGPESWDDFQTNFLETAR